MLVPCAPGRGIPASVIASIGDRISLSLGADEMRKLERRFVGEPGWATLAEMRVRPGPTPVAG